MSEYLLDPSSIKLFVVALSFGPFILPGRQ